MKKSFAVSIVLFFMLLSINAYSYDEFHMMTGFNTKNEPEVVADTITRTASTQEFPLMLLIRHTDRNPVILESIDVTVDSKDGKNLFMEKFQKDLKLKTLLWHENITVKLSAEYTGEAEVTVVFNLKSKHGDIKVVNNNTKKSMDNSIKITMGAKPFPRLDGWYYGDTHFHTIYSDNQVEFGAPIDTSANMAEAYGVDWLVFTDHSFDLDDVEGDTTKNNPELERWNNMKTDSAIAAQSHPDLLVMTGEELSCGNKAGANVHMLVYNSAFFPGNGDGYEGSKTPDMTCEKAIENVSVTGATGAAHPVVELKSVEVYMINRGNWAEEDILAKGLNFDQAWNYTIKPRQAGFDQWIQVLLTGRHMPLAGGTDAHGDFNYQYSGWPENVPFGGIRTAVKVDGALTVESLVAAIRAGRMIATNGPFVMLALVNGNMDRAEIGETIKGPKLMADVRALSSDEFGPISEINIFAGDLLKKEETLLTTYYGKYAENPMDMEETLLLPDSIKNGYVRVEVVTDKNEIPYRAYANPVWFNN